MDPFSQNSFIPRKRIDPASAGLKVKRTVDIFTSIALVVFFVVLFLSLGVTISKIYIQNEVTVLTSKAASIVKDVNGADVEGMVVLDRKINAIEGILDKHVSISSILNFIETTTSVGVAIGSFNYYIDTDGIEKISMFATAKNYNSLSNQSTAYKNNTKISDSIIDGVTPNETGKIDFNVGLLLKSGSFSYSKK